MHDCTGIRALGEIAGRRLQARYATVDQSAAPEETN